MPRSNVTKLFAQKRAYKKGGASAPPFYAYLSSVY